jgi:hypothetical protein
MRASDGLIPDFTSCSSNDGSLLLARMSAFCVQQIDLFERPVSHTLHSIFLSASPSFHGCLTWRALAKSEHTKYTAAEILGRSHTVPATPGFFNLLSSSCPTGRGKPFRFIRNHSRATATNVYLMLYPKPALAKVFLDLPELLKEVWQVRSHF